MQGSICQGGGYILFTILFSFIYNINKFMELQTVYQEVTIGNQR